MTQQTQEIVAYWEKLLGRPGIYGPQLVLADSVVVERRDVRAIIDALAKGAADLAHCLSYRDSDGSGEAVETAQTGSTEGDSAGPKDIAQ
jgi:hypothetical protein